MSVRDWFDSIHDQVTAIAESEKAIRAMRLSIGSHGQSFGPISKGSITDQSAAILSIVTMENELDVMRARLAPELDRALAVLYGMSGRGGLAKLRDSTDADCICGYYLMGMSWSDIASELTPDESTDPAQWCKRRAYRALVYLERCDLDELIGT